MDLVITTLVQRLTCSSYSPLSVKTDPVPLASPPPALAGEILHAMVESYLSNDPVAMSFNLLHAAPVTADQRAELERMACNLLNYANRLHATALSVETEVPLHLLIQTERGSFNVHGNCDCLMTTPSGILAVEWKPVPRTDGLDDLQIKFYLASALMRFGRQRGEWHIYYYRNGQVRRGTAELDSLLVEVRQALTRALDSTGLQAGPHCVGCSNRKECVVSVYALDETPGNPRRLPSTFPQFT